MVCRLIALQNAKYISALLILLFVDSGVNPIFSSFSDIIQSNNLCFATFNCPYALLLFILLGLLNLLIRTNMLRKTHCHKEARQINPETDATQFFSFFLALVIVIPIYFSHCMI